MGDRAVIVFATCGEDYVAVYRHHGGSDMTETMQEFFAAEEANPSHDNRFDDPEYLAARFVVWSSSPTGTGVGIVPVERRESMNVRVHCDSDDRPPVEVIS